MNPIDIASGKAQNDLMKQLEEARDDLEERFQDELRNDPELHAFVEKAYCDYAARIPSIESAPIVEQVEEIRASFFGAVAELLEGEGSIESAVREGLTEQCAKLRSSPQR